MPRRLARARGKGRLHVFWFYMSIGLMWALSMFGFTVLLNSCSTGRLDSEMMQDSALIYFAGGLFVGLTTWATQELRLVLRRQSRIGD